MARLGCPADSVVAGFAGQLLDSVEAASTAAHIRGCSDCQATLARALAMPEGEREIWTAGGETPSQRAGRSLDQLIDGILLGGRAPLAAPGQRIGRYIVDHALGAGGMGIVYLAHDPELDRRVALKLLHPRLVDPLGPVEHQGRLAREAHAMAKVNHVNVVAIYDVGTAGDQVFLAMELVEGRTLKEWLSEKPRPWREILRVFIEAGRGLAAAHAAGVIHRDFKPGNVLIRTDGQVKVTDFGLARAPEPPANSLEAPPPLRAPGPLEISLTEPGRISGTPAYMSPEQRSGGPVDARTDQFSFCVSLQQALFGESPDVAAGPASHAPAWVRAVLDRGLAKDPAGRYPTMAALLEALGADPAGRRRRTAARMAVGASLSLVCALGFFAYRHRVADPCFDPEAKLAGVWDDSTRRAVGQALAATQDPLSASVTAYTEKMVDRTATAWLNGYRDACQQTREAHAAPESALLLRLDCLDRERLNLRALVEFLAHPDGSLASVGTGLAMSLPEVAQCADGRGLALVDPPAPVLRARIDGLRTQLAKGRTLVAAGRTSEALAVLDPLAREAREVSYQPLIAEVLDSLRDAQAAAADLQGSLRTTTQAFDLAEANRMDDLAVELAMSEAELRSDLGQPCDEVRGWADRTRSMAERAGGGPYVQLLLENALIASSHACGATEDWVAHNRRALELAGPDHPQTPVLLNNLAVSLKEAGRYDEAIVVLRQAIATHERLFGTSGEAALAIRYLYANLAGFLTELRRFPEAIPAAEKVLAAPPESSDLWTVIAQTALARSLAAGGQGERALKLNRQAHALQDQLHLPGASWGASWHRLAESALAVQQPRLAIADVERGLATHPPDAIALGVLQTGGAAYLAAGEPNKAIPLLERGLALAIRYPAYPGVWPEMRYNLARALVATHGDAGRAAQLAEQAHAQLVGSPALEPLLQQVDRWRAQAFASR